jgi:hydrogenase nickel incorporation protein HypB
MCATCGCGVVDEKHEHEHEHDHAHTHDGGVPHMHPHRSAREVKLESDILGRNNLRAAQNRGWLEGRQVAALNLMSSPGAGKTTLLEMTVARLVPELTVSIIEGDQATSHDAERVRAAGAAAIQINTGTGCHLDAEMVAKAMQALDPPRGSLLIVENVGNLVCPALFDLGERARVVLGAVTEGDDKPVKYPHMFHAADILVLNKIDLLPYVSFDVDRYLGYARQLNPKLQVFQVSATRGDGLDAWCAFLRGQVPG